jgi:hypothetical protein
MGAEAGGLTSELDERLLGVDAVYGQHAGGNR